MLYLFNFLKSLQFFGAVVVPFYTQRIGFSYTQMFLMELIFSVALFLFEVPTGVVADKAGRKVSVAVGAVLFGLGFVVIGHTHSIAVFVCMQLLTALGMSLMSGADRALVYEQAMSKGLSTADAAAVAARYDAFGTAALLIAFPLGSWFVSSGLTKYTESLGLVFLLSGVATIVSAVALLGVRENRRTSLSSTEKVRENAFSHAIHGFTYIFKNSVLRRFSFNYAVVSALTFLMFWFYQPLLAGCGISVAWNGFVAAGFNAGAIILLSMTKFVTARVRTQTVLFITSVIPGVLYVLVFAFPQNTAVVLTAVFSVTMLRMFRAPLLTTLMNTQIEDDNRATVLSGVSMVERAIISIFYPLAGLLMDWLSRETYLIIGIVTLGVAIAMETVDRQRTIRDSV